MPSAASLVPLRGVNRQAPKSHAQHCFNVFHCSRGCLPRAPCPRGSWPRALVGTALPPFFPSPAQATWFISVQGGCEKDHTIATPGPIYSPRSANACESDTARWCHPSALLQRASDDRQARLSEEREPGVHLGHVVEGFRHPETSPFTRQLHAQACQHLLRPLARSDQRSLDHVQRH
jgi:hypothetical protein